MALLLLASITPHLLFGQQTSNIGENATVLEYQDYTTYNDEPPYKLFEDKVNLIGHAYCNATSKLYILDDRQNIIEYDLANALNGSIRKTKSFHLPFVVETTSNIMEVSPKGEWLAFVDNAGEHLHVYDVASEQEIAACKLGSKFHNEKYFNTETGHPFKFIADNEILVSGCEHALWYNISKDKEKTMSFGREFRDISVKWVTSEGTISGMSIAEPPQPFYVFTFFVENGKIKKKVKEMIAVEYPTFYVHEYYLTSEHEFIDKQSGESFQYSLPYANSDRDKYIFVQNQNLKCETLCPVLLPFKKATKEEIDQYETLKPYTLWFRNCKTWSWLKDNKVLLIARSDGKIQLFNHTLTDNEIAKQVLRQAINARSVDALSQYIGKNFNTQCTNFAKQKRAELINAEWQRLSNRGDLSNNHVQNVINFIAKYDNMASLDAAKEELNWLYKEILVRIPENDVDQFKKYIAQYPQSPNLGLAKERLRNAEGIEQQQVMDASNTVDLSDGLVAYYPFNGNSDDHSGHGNHGYHYKVTLTTGHEGQCYHFGGLDNPSAIIIPRSKSLTYDNAVSYSFWFKLDSYAGYGAAGTKSDYGLMYFFMDHSTSLSGELKGKDNNSFHINFRCGKENCETDISGNAVNNWYHVVFVQSRTTSTIYVNGKKAVSVNRSKVFDPSNRGELYIGQNHFHQIPLFGCVDEFMVFNRALSEVDVFSLYHDLKPDGAKLQKNAKTTPAQQEEEKIIFVNGEVIVMKYVKGGTKKLGNTHINTDHPESMSANDAILYDFECPYQVTLSDYYMGEWPVTENVWNAVMGSIPSAAPGPNSSWKYMMPVENVSWYDCNTFISKLNALTGENFRMPTEAEWEYAAREGQVGPGYDYSGRNGDIDGAWSHQILNRVKLAVDGSGQNNLGICCMSGWVFEWCNDFFDLEYNRKTYELTKRGKKMIDPQGPSSGQHRVIRGGSFLSETKEEWSVYSRQGEDPNTRRSDIGLRLVLPAKKK